MFVQDVALKLPASKLSQKLNPKLKTGKNSKNQKLKTSEKCNLQK